MVDEKLILRQEIKSQSTDKIKTTKKITATKTVERVIWGNNKNNSTQ